MERTTQMRKLFHKERNYAIFYVLCRQKFKMKQTQKTRSIPASDRALDHFDTYYKPVYQKLWPSIRISLLTEKKTCAIMNNFTQINDTELTFATGAYNVIQRARVRQATYALSDISIERSKAEKIEPHLDMIEKSLMPEGVDSEENQYLTDSANSTFNNTEEDRKDLDRTNLDSFVPARIIYTEDMEKQIQDHQQSIFTPMDVKVDIVKGDISLPENLIVMAYPAGNVKTFPDPKQDVPDGHLCHIMMDAASILPVIALDLQEGDEVLDLCAAPGGKTLCMLQTELPGKITCNDISQSRLSRLRNILQFYLPEQDREHVTITTRPGQSYTEPIYDKVLVDVPCNTDRHMLLVDDNNLFSPSRLNDRLEMPKLQTELLVSAIKSCKPGGQVVYSTCTLSPVQNDGVVQDALDNIWKNTSIDVVIEDISEITQIFKDSFVFYDKCRFGQLVIPSLSLNYGPMYFCRIKRLS